MATSARVHRCVPSMVWWFLSRSLGGVWRGAAGSRARLGRQEYGAEAARTEAARAEAAKAEAARAEAARARAARVEAARAERRRGRYVQYQGPTDRDRLATRQGRQLGYAAQSASPYSEMQGDTVRCGQRRGSPSSREREMNRSRVRS